MRLFTAIELDDRTRDGVAREQQRIRSGIGEAAQAWRFVRPEHLHLTLVFIGEITGDPATAVVEAMGLDIAQPVFELVLGGVGTFPPRGRPQVLWLGVQRGATECVALHRLVAERLSDAGVAVDPRPFQLHLTLARCRDRRRAGRLRLPDASGASALVRVEQVTLFQSRLSSAGPTYTALARAHLT
jgi:2'-5' RNA ligase